MDLPKLTNWFLTRSERQKAVLLVSFMHMLTLNVRDAYHHAAQEEYKRLSYQLSELNHRITSKVLGLLEGKQTYPDDVIFDAIFDVGRRNGLQANFLAAWNSLARAGSDSSKVDRS